MYKKLSFLVIIGLLCSSPLFALKGPRATASKSKISETSNTESNNAITATKDTNESSKRVHEKKIIIRPRRPKTITKIFLPGQENKNLICQGIAYLPDELMANGEPRYVLLSLCPNKTISDAPSQLVVIDREIKGINKAIRRFSLMKRFSNTTLDYLEYLTAIEKNTDYDDGSKSKIKYICNDQSDSESNQTTTKDNEKEEYEDSEVNIDNDDDEIDEEDETEEITSVKEISNTSDSKIISKIATLSWKIEKEDNDNNEKDNSINAITEFEEEDDAEIDEKDEDSLKLMVCGGFSVPYKGHAGGIAVAGNYLWVSSNFRLWGFCLKRIKQFIKYSYAKPIEYEKGVPNSLKRLPAFILPSSKEINVDAKSSFLSYDGSYLWVGDYVRNHKNSEGKICPPIEHHKLFKHQAWVAGYKYDEEKDDITSSTTYSVKYNGRKYEVKKPDIVFSIRENAQGFAICGRYIALAISQGLKKSKILVYDNPMVRKLIYTDVIKNEEDDNASESVGLKKLNKSEVIVYSSDSKASETSNKITSKKTLTDSLSKITTYEVDGKRHIIRAYNLSNQNKIAEISKPIPSQIQDLEYDGEKLYATFACNSPIFKDKINDKKLFLTKYFYLIDLKRYLEGNSIIYPIYPIGPIRPKPIKPYRPLIKSDNATYTIQETIGTDSIEINNVYEEEDVDE